MIKYLLSIILVLLSKSSFEQTQLSEVNDKEVAKRIELIKKTTDSFLLNKTTPIIFKKLKADFGVTYLSGEFYINYSTLNNRNINPEDIYQLNQYYKLKDSSISLLANVGISYYENNKLEIRFSSIADSITIQAINRIYSTEGQIKIKNLIRQKQLKNPSVVISIDKKLKSFYVLLKGKNHPHNYLI